MGNKIISAIPKYPRLIVGGIGVVVALVYYGHLFWPEPKLFFTPDYYRSDIWHYHYPVKDVLARSLKMGKLPFWIDEMGTGFPLFAEGQVGALFLPNVILFGLLPTYLAWNLMYPLMFLVNYLGIYRLVRELKVRVVIAVCCGLVYGLSGFFVVRVIHINMVQAAVWLPWMLWIGYRLMQQPTKGLVLWMAVVVMLQITAGYFQISFLSLVAMSVWLGLMLDRENLSRKLKGLVYLGIGVGLGVMLAAPQLLPTLEFLGLSQHAGGNKQVFEHQYHPVELITFVFPNWFGKVSDGSYVGVAENEGLFWENTYFVGVLPILGLLLAVARKKKSKEVRASLVVIGLMILLALGKYSPLSFVFEYPGFGTFRVPQRGLFVVALLVVVLFAVELEKKWKELIKSGKEKLVLGVLLLAFLDAWNFGFDYNPTVSVKRLLEIPEVVAEVGAKRVFTYPSQKQIWYEVFRNEGWQNIEKYVVMREGLAPVSNLIWDVAQVDLYSGLFGERTGVLFREFNRELLDVMSVDFVVSPTELELRDIKQVRMVGNRTDLPKYLVYKNLTSLPRFRLVGEARYGSSMRQIVEEMGNESADLRSVVWVEKEVVVETAGEIGVIAADNDRQVVKTDSPGKSLLVIADSYYPGWEAAVDGAETQVLPVNVNQRGVVVPAGEHEVVLKFVPKMFYYGIAVAMVGLVSYLMWARDELGGLGLFLRRRIGLNRKRRRSPGPVA